MDIKKTSATAVFSTIMLIAAFLFICADNSTAEAPQLKTYSNSETGLTFEYSSGYVLKEFLTPKGKLIAILIGKTAGKENRWLMDIGIEEASSYPREVYDPAKTSVKQFAIDTAINHCAADGPDGGVRCEEVVRLENFRSAHGLGGYEIFLTEISGQYFEDGTQKTEKKVKGPIYAFDISSGGNIRILLIEPTGWTKDYPDETKTLSDIVKSLRRAR
ncbi:MAG: hypothetical protein HZB83_02495 [Deltaproteobacteria bacterium]|nr:hypothetical protein [Deltaproteobacteria bacterium]